MKKFFTLLLAASACTAAWALPEGYQWPETMLTSQPEGECVTTYVSSQISWLLYNQNAGTINGNYGVERHMVTNGNDVYLENFLLEKKTGTWLHGTVQENGDVVFNFPQKISDEGTAQWYVGVLTPGYSEDGPIVLELVPDNCNMTMRWVDGVLTQVLPDTEGITDQQIARYTGMVGVVNQNGNFVAFGEKGYTAKPWTEQPAEAPEFTETAAYELNYIDRDNAEMHTQYTVGFYEDEVWVKGLNQWLPDAWIKGKITETGWEFDMPQYMGTFQSFFFFAMGAEGTLADGLTPKDKITFTLSGESLVSTDVLCMNISTEKLDPSLVFCDMEFIPMANVVQIPDEPFGFEAEWDENDEMGVLYFELPTTDTEGRPLDYTKLFYNVYYNGELHTFTPDEDFVDEAMVDVPALYTNNFTILKAGDGGTIFAILYPYNTVGVRCVYKNAAETTYSDIVTVTLYSGVENVAVTSPVVSREYFTLTGMRVAEPAAGNMYILKSIRADGTVTVSKIAK